jgi:Gem-associated protein 7 (Gemin7)
MFYSERAMFQIVFGNLETSEIGPQNRTVMLQNDTPPSEGLDYPKKSEIPELGSSELYYIFGRTELKVHNTQTVRRPTNKKLMAGQRADSDIRAEARLHYLSMLDLVIGQGGTVELVDGSTARMAKVGGIPADESAVLVAGLETSLGTLSHATLRGCDIASLCIQLPIPILPASGRCVASPRSD